MMSTSFLEIEIMAAILDEDEDRAIQLINQLLPGERRMLQRIVATMQDLLDG